MILLTASLIAQRACFEVEDHVKCSGQFLAISSSVEENDCDSERYQNKNKSGMSKILLNPMV